MILHTVRRITSWVLIGLALWLFFPIPGPDDILNIMLGGYISATFGVSLVAGILATYTIVPLFLLYLGAVISPKDTNGVLRSVSDRLKAVVMRILRSPMLIITGAIIIIIMYFVYIRYISDMIGLTP